MKVLSIIIMRADGCDARNDKQPLVLAGKQDVSDFGFFKRGGIQEFLVFTSRLLVKRAQSGVRETTLHEDYLCHYYRQNNGIASIAICDQEYPKRVAFAIQKELMDQFVAKVPEQQWRTATKDNAFLSAFPALPQMLVKCQDPAQCDRIEKVHRELDATKEILHKTIDSVLERGTKLDNLVDKSDDLSRQSKAFYASAKDTNACCIVC